MRPASLEAIIDDSGFMDADSSGITVSADGKVVTLDADMSGSTAGGARPLEGHVSGTIACP